MPVLDSGKFNLTTRVLNYVPLTHHLVKRLPFGLSSSQDIFQKIMSEMFEDIPGVEVVVNDLLIWGENREEHDERLTQVLQRA